MLYHIAVFNPSRPFTFYTMPTHHAQHPACLLRTEKDQQCFDAGRGSGVIQSIAFTYVVHSAA